MIDKENHPRKPDMTDNPDERLPVVDESGAVTGSASRGVCHDGSKLLHPVVHLHIFNSRGELYLQLRPSWKTIQPNRWDTAVGGHVGFGESIPDALRREATEEVGLNVANPTPIGRYLFESDRERELVYAFRTTIDEPPAPSAETAGGRFWSIEALREAVGRGLLTPNLEQELRRFFII